MFQFLALPEMGDATIPAHSPVIIQNQCTAPLLWIAEAAKEHLIASP